MADCGEVPFVLRVFQRNFLFGKSIPVDGADQLLILLGQSLFEFLNLLIVHLGPLSFARPSWSCHKKTRFTLTYNSLLSLTVRRDHRKNYSESNGRGIIASMPWFTEYQI